MILIGSGTMNHLQRRILKLAAAALIVMLLFPPLKVGYGNRLESTYGFILDLPQLSRIDALLLLIEWLFAITLGGIGFLLARGTETCCETPPLKQYACAACGKFRPTQLVLFRSNVSYFFGRRDRQLCEYLCFPCMSRKFLKFEVVTLLGTWWGLIGLLLGPLYLATNLLEYAKGSLRLGWARLRIGHHSA